MIDAPVVELRTALGFPGMAVLQFAFDPEGEDRSHEPENLGGRQVVYTGTHDNDTVVGWWSDLPIRRRREAERAWRAAGVEEAGVRVVDDPAGARGPLQVGHGAGAGRAVVGLGGADEHTRHRRHLVVAMDPGVLTTDHAVRLREVTEASGRTP